MVAVKSVTHVREEGGRLFGSADAGGQCGGGWWPLKMFDNGVLEALARPSVALLRQLYCLADRRLETESRTNHNELLCPDSRHPQAKEEI